MRAKICILAKLAFGVTVDPAKVPCQGITSITSTDFEYAKLMGCTIKLVGSAARLSKYGMSVLLYVCMCYHECRAFLICSIFSGEFDGALSVFVAPHVVANTHLLAAARGSGNAVAITSANMGTTSYTGPGAGRFPTANSIVADIVRVCDGMACPNPFPMQSSVELDYDYESAFYIRIPFMDSLGYYSKDW